MSNNHRLLLIEDDFDVAEMLLMYFESQNYEVMHADNGTDGIELARTKFPNLINATHTQCVCTVQYLVLKTKKKIMLINSKKKLKKGI